VDTLAAADRAQIVSELIGMLYGACLAIAGLVWLTLSTDLAVLRAAWPTLLILLTLAILLNWLDFFWIVERRNGSYERWSASLSGLVTTSATLLFGPTAIWLGITTMLITATRHWRSTALATQRRDISRNLALNLGGSTLGSLLGLACYQLLGGTFPLAGFSWPAVPLAALSVLILLGVDWLCWSCGLVLVRWVRLNWAGARELGLFAFFEVVAYLPEFLAILAAAIYIQLGLAAYLALIASALLVSILTQRLSQAAERSMQRSRELVQLEQLGRAIIAAPPDGATLPDLLARFVPPMFRHEQIEITLRTGQTLLRTPDSTPPVAETVWQWLYSAPQPLALVVGQPQPWDNRRAVHALAATPIVGVDTSAVLGGIYVAFSPTVDAPAAALPALQPLAAQVASALYRAEEYARTLAHQRIAQDLAMAAEIQASLLPASLPTIDGWQLSATLRPARQISGDFYDLLELPDGRLGLLIADVTDKGTGAALFMAMSRTLIRTFAFKHPDQPALIFQSTNTRILSDSRSSMFVTAFYGILDPASGALSYCNAGHNPPYILRAGATPQPLPNTGIPLGILPDADWACEQAQLAPGDVLLLYTDGITEAHSGDNELFEVERLLAAAQGAGQCSVEGIQGAILAAVDRFVGEADQFDDLTMLLALREM
jgi:serine phosphatase RsbU (regulator of sigma subunit)